MLSLAAMATTSTPAPEAISALQAATQADRAVVTVSGVGEAAFAAAPDGSLVAVDRADGSGFVLVDPRDGKVATTVTTTHPAAYLSLGFAPTGTAVAIGYAIDPSVSSDAIQPVAEQFSVPGGQSLGTLDGPAGSYETISYDATGRWLGATRNTPKGPTVMGWDLTEPGAPPAVVAPGIEYRFLPGQRMVVVDEDSPTLTVYDLSGGAVHEDHQIQRPDTPYNLMAVDPTGRMVAVTSLPARADVLDIATGATLATLDLLQPRTAGLHGDGKHPRRRRRRQPHPHLLGARVHPGAGDRRDVRPTDQDGVSADDTCLVSAVPGQLRTFDLTPQGPPALGNSTPQAGSSAGSPCPADGSAAW